MNIYSLLWTLFNFKF